VRCPTLAGGASGIGCDYHAGLQQIALVDTETGELQERRLQHREEAEKFYRDLGAQGASERVGMEASGHARWFERLLAELQFELWIGDVAEIRTKRPPIGMKIGPSQLIHAAATSAATMDYA
jgi:hypothetical protein